MNPDDRVDQYFIRGYGWQTFCVPASVRWLKAHLHQWRGMESVRIVGKGDFTRRELEAAAL